MLKTEHGGTYEVQAEYDPLSASKSFWDMVGTKSKTFASVLNDEVFPVYGDNRLQHTPSLLKLDSLSTIVIGIRTGIASGDKGSWKRTLAPRCAC